MPDAVPRTDAPTLLAWLEPEQAEFVRAVVAAAGVRVALAGAEGPGRSAEVARALGAEPAGDLRAALASAAVDAVLLADPAALTDAGEAEALAACRERGVRVLSFEPRPAGLLEAREPGRRSEGPGLALGPGAADAGAAPEGAWAELVPLTRASRAVRDAADVVAQLGTLRLVSVQAWSGTGQGSLGARVYDALDLVVHLMGQPDGVDAAYVPAPGLADAAGGPTLRGIDGDLSANLRFAGGRAASVVASSRAGKWGRLITLVGERGRVRVFEDGLEWVGPDGRLIDASRDSSRIRGAAGAEDPAAPAVRAFADRLERLLDPRVPPEPPTSAALVLATAGAALLSARTGQSESPETVLGMR
jgi:hypothetical protein